MIWNPMLVILLFYDASALPTFVKNISKYNKKPLSMISAGNQADATLINLRSIPLSWTQNIVQSKKTDTRSMDTKLQEVEVFDAFELQNQSNNRHFPGIITETSWHSKNKYFADNSKKNGNINAHSGSFLKNNRTLPVIPFGQCSHKNQENAELLDYFFKKYHTTTTTEPTTTEPESTTYYITTTTGRATVNPGHLHWLIDYLYHWYADVRYPRSEEYYKHHHSPYHHNHHFRTYSEILKKSGQPPSKSVFYPGREHRRG